MVVMQETLEVKVGLLQKRSQNKSFLFTRDNFKTRVFVLDSLTLRYFKGTAEKRGDRKARIDLCSVLAVENIEDKLLDGKHNVFQIVYRRRDDQIPLYVICPSANSRDTWVSAIRAEAEKNKAQLQDRFHKGVWYRKRGYNCCKNIDRNAMGCVESTYIPASHGRNSPTSMSLASFTSANIRLSNLLVDTMLKRSVGKSTFFPRENYKSRTFVLDANSVRYYDGDTRVKRNEKSRIHLSCVVTVEPVTIEDDANHSNIFQIAYFDDYELYHLYIVAPNSECREKWIKAVKKAAIKSGAEFMPSYHSGCWVRHKGKWACCGNENKRNEGCRRVVVQADMKLCGSELNTSITPSNRAKSPPEVKVACMSKRSQNKGTFLSASNYQQRVFTLDHQCLAFYTGYLEDRGTLKGYIPLADMVTVETVRDGMLEDKVNVFQVLYYEGSDLFNLYIVATSDKERNSWIAAIKKEITKANVVLHPRYHPGVWLKSTRNYNCCGRADRDSIGCTDVSGMSLVSVRDRLNTLDSAKGMRHRLGTLDSVPEEVVPKSDRLSPHDSRTKTFLDKNHSTPIASRESSSLPPREPSAIEKSRMKQNDKFKKQDHGVSREPSLHSTQWSKGITDIATSTTGIRPVGSGYQMDRGRSAVYSSGTSKASSRQPSFVTCSHYSEDFESVSEIDV